MQKLDEYILRRLNDAYLWLMDWTGIYVGSVIFLLNIPSVMNLIRNDSPWLGAFLLMLVILGVAGPRYLLQGRSVKLYNEVVLSDFILVKARYFFVPSNIVFAGMDIATGRWLGFTSSICLVFMWYAFGFLIRDREKKTFNLGLRTAEEGAQ